MTALRGEANESMFIRARAYLSAKFWAIFMALQTYKMKVVIIGSGNVATVLGGKIAAAGHTILQVVARRSAVPNSWPPGGDAVLLRIGRILWKAKRRVYIVALSDTALVEFGERVRLPGRLVLHTAGAVSGTVLQPVSAHCGCLYPLQSLRREIHPFSGIPVAHRCRRTGGSGGGRGACADPVEAGRTGGRRTTAQAAM